VLNNNYTYLKFHDNYNIYYLTNVNVESTSRIWVNLVDFKQVEPLNERMKICVPN